MDRQELLEKMSEAYDELQNLVVQPTEGNIRILMDVMETMKAAYAALDTEKNPEVDENVPG